jgi:hypothetical protein
VLDTGWNVPPGVMHAPGSLCTYEPQFASDVYAMYQSVLMNGQCVPTTLLWKDTPQRHLDDFDYLLDVIDWQHNVDPAFHEHQFMMPRAIADPNEMEKEGYVEEWICYKCREVSAKRLTVLPGSSVTVRDSAAYGFIMLQGRGRIGVWDVETPALIRYGQQTYDEFFVTEATAKKGVRITNPSGSDPIVLLKHFAENPDLRLGDV